MSDINTDVQDAWQPYVNEPDIDEQRRTSTYGPDEAGGTTPVSLSLPDEAPRAEVIIAVAHAITQAIDAERKRIATVNDYEYNSKNVSFSRYSVPVGQPIQIVREKQHRGDTVITAYTDGATVHIGLHVGIRSDGTDTCAIVGAVDGSARTIKTRQALWAIASGDACSIDVQEEFD